MIEQTDIERGFAALQSALTDHLRLRPECPDQVYRNRTVGTLIDELRGHDGMTGAAAVWNLIDDTGTLLAEEIGAEDDDGPFEVQQRAWLEIAVIHPDDAPRDAALDAQLVALKTFLLAEQRASLKLGGVVEWIGLTQLPERQLLMGVVGAKAARVPIDMLRNLETLLG